VHILGEYATLYIGYGMKASAGLYYPEYPPNVQQEPRDGTEMLDYSGEVAN